MRLPQNETQTTVTTWSSARELILTDSHRAREAEMVELDSNRLLPDVPTTQLSLERAAGYVRSTRSSLILTEPTTSGGIHAIFGKALRSPRTLFRIAKRNSVVRFGFNFLMKLKRRFVVSLSRPAQTLPVSEATNLSIIEFPKSFRDANEWLAGVTTPYIAILRGGAQLPKAGYLAIMSAAQQLPNAVLFYGDYRMPNGLIIAVPKFSPIRLLEEDYLGPVVVVATEWLRACGGFSAEADGAQILDLVINAPKGSVAMIPGVVGDLQGLAPRGSGFSAASDRDEDGVRVVRRFLDGRDIGAEVSARSLGLRKVTYPVVGNPLVSIIIPTRGSAGVVAGKRRELVTEVVRGIVEHSSWSNVEVIVVADDLTPQIVIDNLVEVAGEKLVLVRWSEQFNFSAKMNRGAAVATGEFLLMLNDDIEIVNPDWLERMISVCQLPGVGMTGALLFFEDRKVQHLGHIYAAKGIGHVGHGLEIGARTPIDTVLINREVSGVTAACSLISAQLFRELGGFSTKFPGNYNDVDLCLKVREAGYDIVCVGEARLYHFESRSRNPTVRVSERVLLNELWGAKLNDDDYFPKAKRRKSAVLQ